MMFHFAPPEVCGLGVTTCTPGLTTSAQVRMFFGLPLRTARTTTELVTVPLVGPAAHPFATLPASTSFSTSGASETATTSAGSPAITARACSPEAPKDCLNSRSRRRSLGRPG